MALLAVAGLSVVWALAQPGDLTQVDQSPRTRTPQGSSDGPTSPIVSPSGASVPSAPTPSGPTSLGPTALPTIGECIAPRRFSVLTFNIHGGRTDRGLDLAAVIAEIRQTGADVVLLQEVDRHLARTGFLNQPAVLAEALGMAVYYEANVRSNAILTRFPVVEWSSTALPRWPGKEERRLVHASVVVEGQVVHVFNTHLDHTSVALRLAQIRAVNRVMERFADAPMILGGDLNAIPGGSVLTALRSDVRDAWPGEGKGPGNTVPAHDPRRRIDYLLHNSWLSTHAARVLPTRASDHAALRIAFDLWDTQGCAG